MVEIDAARVRRQLGAQAGRFVCLQVTDSGCGMDQKTLERIFEPFFSTKEVGKGTGLGLATVYGIVKQHQGWIEVTSKVGAGTTFQIFLPAVARSPDRTLDTSFLRRVVEGKKETILLVEDERALREMVREVLLGYNYNVIEATDGVDALKVWDAHNGGIDLLLTDIVMPGGMNGHELATHLRQRKPKIKVIYTSGYDAPLAGGVPSQRDGLYLAKPYRPAALGELVRACLDGTAETAPGATRIATP